MPISKNIKPKKSLGQNFLNDDNISKKIVEAVEANEDDLLLEIGPGTGALTKHLYKENITYKGIEIDDRSAKVLIEDFKQKQLEKFEIINADFKKIKFEDFKSKSKIKIFGNLPYYLTSPILFKTLENSANIDSAVFMVQREVAQRMVAKEGSKENGILAILIASKGEAQKLFDVAPTCFYPQPKVWSSVVKIKFNRVISDNEFKTLKSMVKRAFNQRRKMLSNSLKEDFKKVEEENNPLKKYYSNRPEDLTYEEFLFINKTIYH